MLSFAGGLQVFLAVEPCDTRANTSRLPRLLRAMQTGTCPHRRCACARRMGRHSALARCALRGVQRHQTRRTGLRQEEFFRASAASVDAHKVMAIVLLARMGRAVEATLQPLLDAPNPLR